MKKRIMRICTVMVLTLSLIGVLFARMQGNAKAGNRVVIDNMMLKTAIASCSSITTINVKTSLLSGGTHYDLNSDGTVVGVLDGTTFSICPKTAGDTIAMGESCIELFSNTTYQQAGCTALSKLKTVNLHRIDFSGVTSMNSMFYGSNKLTSVTIDWNTVTAVTDFTWAFRNCSALTSIDLSGIDASHVTSTESMFAGSGLTSFSFAGFNINPTVMVRMLYMFDLCENLQSVDMSTLNITDNSPDNIKIDMRYMFQNCKALTSISVGRIMLSKNCKVDSMFQGCESLTGIDMSQVTLNGIKSLKNMFTGCKLLKSIDLSFWDTTNITILEGLFSGCASLTSVNLTNWNTAKVRTMAHMFKDCSSLTSIDLSNFTCERLKDTHPTPSSDSGYSLAGTSSMFEDCTKLQYVNLSGFRTDYNGNPSKFIMEYMFWGCENIESINFSNFVPATSGFGTRYGVLGDEDVDMASLTHVCMTSQEVLNTFYNSAYGHGTNIKSHEYVDGICLGCGTCRSVVETGNHHMVNGVCTVCNFGGNNYQMQASLTLKSNISMNLAFYLPNDVLNDNGAYVLITFANDANGSRTKKIFIKDTSEVLINKKTWRSLSYELAAKEMADEATVKVYRGNGTECYAPTNTVSVKSYGEAIYNNSASSTKEKNLVKALLNYGAYAQKYFKYETNNLANAVVGSGIASAQTVLDATGDYTLEVHDNGAKGVNFEGCSLILEDTVKVRYWFTFDSSLSSTEKNKLINSMHLTAGSGGKYYAESTNRNVLYWGYVNEYSGGNYYIKYSVVSYMRDVLTVKESGALYNLVRSMYSYWKAALAYAN